MDLWNMTKYIHYGYPIQYSIFKFVDFLVVVQLIHRPTRTKISFTKM